MRFSVLLTALAVAIMACLAPPVRAHYPAGAGTFRSRGFTNYRSFGYGTRAYAPSVGYATQSYGYAPSYYPSYTPSYAPSYSYAPAYVPSYYYVLQQPVLVQPTVQAPVAPVAAPEPLPPPMPQATVALPPVYVPAPTVCAQEVQQGYLSEPTLNYLNGLPVYDRYAFLHDHYGHAFAERAFRRHFGSVPAGFRNRLQGRNVRPSRRR